MTPVEAVSGGVPAKPGEPGPGEAVKPQAECRKLGGGVGDALLDACTAGA